MLARMPRAEVVAPDEVAVVHVMNFFSFQFSVFSFQFSVFSFQFSVFSFQFSVFSFQFSGCRV
jgi:hypothetical protein